MYIPHCYFTRLHPKKRSLSNFACRHCYEPKSKIIFEIHRGILEGRTNRALPHRGPGIKILFNKSDFVNILPLCG